MRKRKRPPPHPGAVLRLHYLEPSGISVTDLAKELRLWRGRIRRYGSDQQWEVFNRLLY